MRVRKLQGIALALGVFALFSAASAQDATPTPTPAALPAWTYFGAAGPLHWGELDDAYAACASGEAQSPIDIPKSAGENLPDIAFNYQQSSLTYINDGSHFVLLYDPGSTIVVDHTTYELKQITFHSLSEHKFDGKGYPIEIELRHETATGRIAIVSVMVQRTRTFNGVFRGIWNLLRTREPEPKTIIAVPLNASEMLPADHTYYSYTGSLTTPPCTEGVTWIILKTPITMASSQITQFNQTIAGNTRPVQPLNGREVLSDSAADAP